MNNINITEKMTRSKLTFYAIILLTIVILSVIWYGLSALGNVSQEISTISNKLSALENSLASTTENLNANIQKSNATLSTTLKENVGNIEQKLGAYSQEVGSYTNTVTTLQKLSKTDPELLAKYSKVFFLNENYAPSRLTEIPEQYRFTSTKPLKIQSDVLVYLQKMVLDASTANNLIYVQSAYRSFSEQKSLKGQYSVNYGSGTANTFSADQGYSEHQLGTTVDLTTPGIGAGLEGFERTDSYKWLVENAHKYGFVLSYPKNNKFYVFEPWHWRFVGIKLATDLHKQGKGFYDMDQRDIDEYLANLFD